MTREQSSKRRRDQVAENLTVSVNIALYLAVDRGNWNRSRREGVLARIQDSHQRGIDGGARGSSEKLYGLQ